MKRFVLLPFSLALLVSIKINAQTSQPMHSSEQSTLELRCAIPMAHTVSVRGSWSPELVPLKINSKGIWTAPAPLIPPGCYPYTTLVDGASETADPSTFQVLHIPTADSTNFPASAPHGLVHGHRYFSKVMGIERECWIYTPSGYEKGDERYPFLVLQHAGADTQKTWVGKGDIDWLLDKLIAEGRATPMVVLMLDGHPHGESEYVKVATRFKAMKDLQQELLDEAIPLVESHYRIESSRELRALAGPSVGGGQVLSIGLGHLDRFAWIGVFNSGHAIPEFYQSALSDRVAVNSQLKLFWISCGTEDPEFHNNEKFVEMLTQAGVHHEWYATAGAHRWSVWRRDLGEYLCRIFQPESRTKDERAK